MPALGPIDSPTEMTALARPRRCSGAWRASRQALAGKITLSPNPSSRRRANSTANPLAKALSRVAPAQTARPPASTSRTSARWASHPANGWAGA